jgi:hypothetical protein
MRSAFRPWLTGTLTAVCLVMLSGGMATAQQTQRFEEKTTQRLAELQIGSGEVQSIRYVLKRKLDDKAGPDIRGAYAYIRLSRCSGYLVVDMNRTGYIRQTYTTGDCEVAGVPAY